MGGMDPGLSHGLAGLVRRLVGRFGHPADAGPPREPSPAADAAPATAAPRTVRRVMVIEDDAIVRLGLQAVLQDLGDEVILAGSAAEALDRLAAGASAPDVIVADYRLRDGQVGTDAIRQVRAAVGQPVPGVLLTGDTGADLAEEAGRDGLLLAGKPIGARELGRVIGRAMAA